MKGVGSSRAGKTGVAALPKVPVVLGPSEKRIAMDAFVRRLLEVTDAVEGAIAEARRWALRVQDDYPDHVMVVVAPSRRLRNVTHSARCPGRA